MKMEAVEKELKSWGELIVSTSSGEVYEIHLGDTTFDTNTRIIKLTTPEAEFMIDGDAVENIKKHYGHQVSADH